MSWTINRQPQFRSQPKDHCLVWVYSLFTDKPGDFVKKPMRECTGKEICMEWLYHLGVPVEQIEDMAENSANTVPVMMPYIDAFFMPRAYGDRPKVVPDGAVNFAFLGQFAETPRDTIFTTEYSMRTGMEAVYTLLNIDRGVSEVGGSVYDVRDLLDATVKLRDGKKPIDMELNLVEKMALKKVLGKIEGTDIEKLLKEYHIICCRFPAIFSQRKRDARPHAGLRVSLFSFVISVPQGSRAGTRAGCRAPRSRRPAWRGGTRRSAPCRSTPRSARPRTRPPRGSS